MGHRINVWVQRLLAPGFAVAGMILIGLGLGAYKILAILLPSFVAVMVLLIVLDPGPRAKAFVESLRHRPH